MKKNIMTVVLTLGMTVLLAACGNAQTTSTPTVTSTPVPTEIVEPTEKPTEVPVEPTKAAQPTATNVPEPTTEPTSVPTEVPTSTPEPTVEPTETPTSTPEPTATPTSTPEPTATPTETPKPTVEPTVEPTSKPEPTPEPTAVPTEAPVQIGKGLFGTDVTMDDVIELYKEYITNKDKDRLSSDFVKKFYAGEKIFGDAGRVVSSLQDIKGTDTFTTDSPALDLAWELVTKKENDINISIYYAGLNTYNHVSRETSTKILGFYVGTQNSAEVIWLDDFIDRYCTPEQGEELRSLVKRAEAEEFSYLQ